MLEKVLIESTDDNSNFKEPSNLKIIEFEKANIMNQENELIFYDRKVFSDYLNKIQNCEEKIKLFQILAYISIIIFFSFLVVKYGIEKEKELKYYYMLLPTLFAILSFYLSINYFLGLKHLIEKEEEDIIIDYNSNKFFSNFSVGNFLSYLSLNLICLAICIFFILLFLKLENQLQEVGIATINIPIFISLGIIIFYFIFILPAFIFNKYYWVIILVSSYLINSVAFIILLSIKLDNQTKLDFEKIFIPVFIALGVHISYSIFQIFCAYNHFFIKILNLIVYLLILASFIYLEVNLDSKENKLEKNKYHIALLFLFSAMIFSIEKITSLYVTYEDLEEKE